MSEMKGPGITEDDIIGNLHQLEEDELVDYIRETVVRLESLADRLEGYVGDKGDDREERDNGG